MSGAGVRRARHQQLALQFHLETEPARFESWLVGHTVELGKAGIDPRELRAQARTLGPATRELGSKVLAAWLDKAVGGRLSFPDIVADLRSKMPALRGRLLANQSLAELTWFRVGGPAQVLFMPEDENDLAYLLAHLPAEIPVTVIGLGSNLIVRDGGVPGVVVRLGRGFNDIAIEGLASAPAPRCLTSRSRARRRRPALPDCRSCAVFRAASAARCA